MKVLMLGWEMPPHHVGGMGIVCYQMSKELANQGVDIEFILPFTADFNIDFMKISPAHDQTFEELMVDGGVYDSALYSSGNSSIGLNLHKQYDRYAHRVSKMVKYREFDIIHAHDWLTFRAGLLAKQVSGKPLILHVHSTQYDQSGGNKGNPEVREIEYTSFMMADYIFAISNYVKNTIVREYGIDPAKIHVVHNSMDLVHDIDESYNSLHYLQEMKSRGYKIVVNAGRKTLQKGLTHMIEAATKVVAKNDKVLFFLAGAGDQEDELLELAARHRISDKVIFHGWLNGTGKQWRDCFKIADVFVMPSVSEPFGVAPIEAIGYGAPVVISKQSGVSEIINNCYKVDFWDTDQMADMILTLCENDSLRRTMWQNSFSEIQHMSWARPAQLMQEHYLNAAKVGVL